MLLKKLGNIALHFTSPDGSEQFDLHRAVLTMPKPYMKANRVRVASLQTQCVRETKSNILVSPAFDREK